MPIKIKTCPKCSRMMKLTKSKDKEKYECKHCDIKDPSTNG